MEQNKAKRVLTFPALNPAHHDAPLERLDEDPLSWPLPPYNESHGPVIDTPIKKRIAVVLASSPKSGNDGYEEAHDEDALAPVGSDFVNVVGHESLTGSMGDVSVASHTSSTGAAQIPSVRSGRGRPRGWKPGMSYALMRGNSPRVAGSTTWKRTTKPGESKRRRGRPAKVSGTPPREVYRKLNPPLISFLCEWAGCKAELHNLDTLRRHVLIVHGRADAVQCQWGRCGSEEQQSSKQTLRGGDEFTAHVEEAHLVPVGWYVGDGPRNTLDTGRRTAEDVPGFLKDTQGNQVTPWVRHQEVEDQVTWKNNRRKLKALLMRRDQNLPDEDSSDEGPEELK
ncbi:hypothetical protein HJFPF1_07965 [Paramyrothecium foliicola]|nr:hypothetical protein HJFPF1_07965 [Paramyrothecium foliicola]